MNAVDGRGMPIVTTERIVDAQIVTTLGLVFGLAIHRRGIGGNIMAGLEALGNKGALAEYREELMAIRGEAVGQLAREARACGGNAVVGMRFETAAVGHEMSEVVAYGTAVVIAREP